MGAILNAYIMPHPPIIIPGIGEGRESAARATIEACGKIAEKIADDAPSTIILSTPHAPCFRDFIVLSDTERLYGDFGSFGHAEITIDFANNAELASTIIEDAQEENISAGFLSEIEKRKYNMTDRIDHGAMVPLYFTAKALEAAHLDCKLILVSTPFLPLDEIFRFGKSMRKTILHSGERVVYIASGDLSHRLTPDAPAGYTPYGAVYDKRLVDWIRNNNVDEILKIREKEMDDAGQCGTRSFAMMYGVLDPDRLETTVYSYEGPFGVGYLAAGIKVQPGLIKEGS